MGTVKFYLCFEHKELIEYYHTKLKEKCGNFTWNVTESDVPKEKCFKENGYFEFKE